jgi:hypothetical protein
MQHLTHRLRAGLVSVAGAVLLAACATGPEIRRDTNPSANFAEFKTFGYFSPLATDSAGYETVFTARLKEATRRNLEAKGYVYSEADPDLLVNFYANVEDRQEIRTSPVSMGYYGYRRGFYGGISTQQVETVNYKTGTLTIDVIDREQKSLVWEATAEGRVSREARKNPGPAIDAVVDQMMAPLPGPGRM